jgi:hypothetical protein
VDGYPLFINLPYALTSFSDYTGNALDRAVFADIAQFANRYGVAYTTERRIAERIGRSRKEVSRSVNRMAKKTGHLTITKEKKGQDKHPRNIYHIAKQFIRRHPDKRSKHYNAAAWKRWCEIGRKRAITIKLKQKKTGTIRDTAAEMASQPIAASASPTPAVQLTPAQAREARARRGGSLSAFGDVLTGLSPTASAPVQAVKDDYSQQVPRGGWSQALREHEAAAAMASQQTQAAAPMSTAQPVPPIQQPPTRPTASEQRERRAQAYDELQPLRERLRQQGTASSQAPADDTAGAWQEVARDYARASRPAAMASPWASWAAAPTAPTDPTPRGDMAQARRELQQLRARRAAYSADPWATSTAPAPVQQPQATADMQQEAASAWLAGLEATRRQAARDVRKMASQRAGYAAAPSSVRRSSLGF